MADALPLVLAAYRTVTGALGPRLAPRVLKRRLKAGKETAGRIAERRGEPGAPRPRGPLVWVHGASVGEFVAALPLVEQLCRDGVNVLMTTGTVTSAALAAGRLPPGALHQFVPLDVPAFVTRFLDHWRPDLALLVESELWPNTILTATAHRVPLVLVNGRMSTRSFAMWRRLPRTIAGLLSRFELCLVRSRDDQERFAALGAPRIRVTGNLKFDVPALAVDEAGLAALRDATRGRTVVAAASTHPGEDQAVVDAHRRLRVAHPGLLTVIAPRHPQRGGDVAATAAAAGLTAVRRSHGAVPGSDTDVYVFDTLGELGLVYRLADTVFMGGSLVPHGGQNPIEALKLGAAVLHGPHIGNFADTYADLGRDGGAVAVSDAASLAAAIAALLDDAGHRSAVADRGRRTVEDLSGALARTTAALETWIAPLRRTAGAARATSDHA